MERERKREERKREEERGRRERKKERDNLVYLYRISGSESLRKSSKYEEGVRLMRLSTSSPSNHLYKRSL